MMTKKDFQALAEGLRRNRPDDGSRQIQWASDCNVIAYVCAAANPRFNFERFIEWTER